MTNGNGRQRDVNVNEPVDRVVDLFVHVPVGLALMAWKRMPDMVTALPELVGQAMARGCAQIAEAEARLAEEVRKARMIGQVAVMFGGRQLRREVDARLAEARQAAAGVVGFIPGVGRDGEENGAGAGPGVAPAAAPVTTTATRPTPSSPPAEAAAAAPTRTAAPGPVTETPKRAVTPPASAADLPILEYDGLSASQVVSRLTGLSADELRAVRAYEEASRGRRTVLLAVDRLLG
jgi:hypothetical protein